MRGSTLPFDFGKHFVPDVSSPDCLGACFAMCNRYWMDHFPNLRLNTDLRYWNSYLQKINSSTPRGISTVKLLSTLKSDVDNSVLLSNDSDDDSFVSQVIEYDTRPPLIIKPFNLKDIDAANGFLSHSPPIPLILFFDQSMAQNNQEGGGPCSASLFF